MQGEMITFDFSTAYDSKGIISVGPLVERPNSNILKSCIPQKVVQLILIVNSFIKLKTMLVVFELDTK